MELPGSTIKKILTYYLILRETETPTKIPYISGNANTKEFLKFREMELSSRGSKK